MTSPSRSDDHVSPSQMRLYDECPARYAARYLRGVADGPPSHEMQVGRLVHQTLHGEFLKRGSSIVESAAAEAAPLEVIADAHSILTGAVVDLDAAVGAEVEYDFHIIATGTVVRCIVDRIDVAPDGTVRVIDYKTGGNIMSRSEMGTDPQVLLYLACVRAAYPDAPRVIAIWHYLSQDIQVHLVHDEALVAPALIAASALAARKLDPAATWPERVNRRCGDCPVRADCASYRAAADMPVPCADLAGMAAERVKLNTAIKIAEARKAAIDERLSEACQDGPVLLGSVEVSRSAVQTRKHSDMSGVCRTLAQALGGAEGDYIARIADVSGVKLRALVKGNAALEEQLAAQAEVSVYYKLTVSGVKEVF